MTGPPVPPEATAAVDRLLAAGYELAQMLGDSPGIDPMRLLALRDWRKAVLDLEDSRA